MGDRELAIFGAEPAFKVPLCVGKPNLVSLPKILANVTHVLESRWLTNDGPCVHKLEQDICRRLNVAHCIAVANGTLGLELAVRALVSEGAEIIVPSFTFIATPNALRWQQYKVVFADIDLITHVLDPEDVAAKITERTGAILGVHVWGTPCAIEPLTDLACKHGIPLIFDAAHAFCTEYDWRSIGNFGACEVFSFHATKFFNTVEGGAITTNDAELAKDLREMRNFGFVGDNSHNVAGIGINAKMSEVHAAIGIANLVSVTDFIQQNTRNYLEYRKFLQHESLHVYNVNSISNHQYVVVELIGDDVSADVLERVLRAENVLARRYFSPPCHLMDSYSDEYWVLPVTEQVAKRTLVLPTGMSVSLKEIDIVCQIVLYYVEHAAEIATKLAEENNYG